MIKLTDAQREAVAASGCDILVSAAAGSGKTSTLTERIKKRIISDGMELSKMPVVTFSRASAADVKLKISKALADASASYMGEGDEESLRAARASAEVASARVGTIHSFCYSLLRRYYGELGLPPKLRIAEDSEDKLMRRRAMEDTLDELAQAGTECGGDTFLFLSDQLAGSADDSVMTDTLLELYEKTSCYIDGFHIIGSAAEELAASVSDGFYKSAAASPLRTALYEDADYYEAVFESASEYFLSLGSDFAKNTDTFSVLAKMAGNLKGCFLRGDMKGAEEIISQKLPTVSKKGTEGVEAAEFYIEKKQSFSDFLRRTRKKYLSFDEASLNKSVKITVSIAEGIVSLLERFEERYTEEKLRRGLCNYTDLERYAYKLLQNDETAVEVAADIDEIFIDEYQDVNEIQDAIFKMISSARAECRRFMVGDVKQSIYGFRGADPTIFDKYRRSFSEGEEGKLIFMSENFRCDEGIVNFTNDVTGRLFSCGNVSFTEDDALRHAKGTDGVSFGNVRFIIAERGDEAVEAEAEGVAAEAEKLMRGGRAADDIVILMRSAKDRAAVFENALRRHNIPVRNDTIPSFFECPEVLLMLCLIGMSNNPLYDIYTAGALRSPVFGFSLDELIAVKGGGDEPLYRALIKAAEDGSEVTDELRAKCADAAEIINEWRECAVTMPSDEFVLMLYRKTGMEGIIASRANMSVGSVPLDVRRENLTSFYEYAKRFESGSFRGVHRFLEYINDMIERGVSADIKRTAGGGCVKIMTIHQSKGLEFPVVFLSGCGSKRNASDTSKSLLFDRETGVAMKIRPDSERAAVTDTLLRASASAAIEKKNDSEEMRILYVGLTRAKEQLYITAETKRTVDELLSNAACEACFFSPHTVREKKTPLEWILTAAIGEDGRLPYEIIGGDERVDEPRSVDKVGRTVTDERSVSTTDADLVSEAKETMLRNINFVYPYERTGGIPAKISVSRLTPDYLDRADDDSVPYSFDVPEEKTEAALAGTATHLFLQFCDFESAAKSIDAEADRLVTEGFMRQSDRLLIRTDEAKAFFRSKTYKKLASADRVWREKRFNVPFPASEFTEDESAKRIYAKSEVLVQGVIDCMYVTGGEVTVIDYKTDRLTPYEIAHREAAEEKLRFRHSRQLSLYGRAAAALFGKQPAHLYVYSLALGDEIEIDLDADKK